MAWDTELIGHLYRAIPIAVDVVFGVIAEVCDSLRRDIDPAVLEHHGEGGGAADSRRETLALVPLASKGDGQRSDFDGVRGARRIEHPLPLGEGQVEGGNLHALRRAESPRSDAPSKTVVESFQTQDVHLDLAVLELGRGAILHGPRTPTAEVEPRRPALAVGTGDLELDPERGARWQVDVPRGQELVEGEGRVQLARAQPTPGTDLAFDAVDPEIGVRRSCRGGSYRRTTGADREQCRSYEAQPSHSSLASVSSSSTSAISICVSFRSAGSR